MCARALIGDARRIDAVQARLDAVLNDFRQVREEVAAAERLDRVAGRQVLLPVRVECLRVGHDDGNGPRRRGYARDVVVAFRQDERDFPGERRNCDVSLGERRRKAVATCAAHAGRPGNDVDLVILAAYGQDASQVTLEVRPRPLVVGGRLRNHVRTHQVSFLIDGDPVQVVAVGVRTHVAAVEPGGEEIECLHAIPIWWNGRIGTERVNPRQPAEPRRVEMPAHPVRRALAPVVGERVGRLLHQIVVWQCHVRSRVGRVAHRQMDARRIWSGLSGGDDSE